MHFSLGKRSVPTLVLVVALLATALIAVPFWSKSSAQAESGHPVAPSGIDVAGHQRIEGAPIDWNAVAADGQRFTYVKATEGQGWTNDFYAEDVAAAGAAGLYTGAYHYARPDGDPVAQATHFANIIGAGAPNALPPVLDIEETDGRSAQELQDWTRTFLGTLESLTGQTPMIYTYSYFWIDEMDNTTEFSNYPLWLAAYQPTAPAPVGGWDTVSIWQSSETGTVPGIGTHVDTNLFNGTDAQLDAFANGIVTSAGGVLNSMPVDPGQTVEVFEEQSTQFVGDVLDAVGQGVAGPEAAEAVNNSGIGEEEAAQIEDFVLQRLDSGEVPAGQQEMDQTYEVVPAE